MLLVLVVLFPSCGRISTSVCVCDDLLTLVCDDLDHIRNVGKNNGKLYKSWKDHISNMKSKFL